MHSPRRHAVLLVLVLGVVALLAQLAGVGTTRPTKAPGTGQLTTLRSVPGGSVPDVGSSQLASTKVRARAGEVVRMTAQATVAATKLSKSGVTQVVCGIRYSRAGDASWSLGTPYETVVLKRRSARERIKLERSFAAPTTDTYRMSTACHVAAPATGAKVLATGAIRVARGLPKGAATPVA